MYRKQNKKFFRLISAALICLFLWNQVVWAYPAYGDALRPLSTANSDKFRKLSPVIPPYKERLVAVQGLARKQRFFSGLGTAQRLSVEKLLAQTYLNLIVTEKELRDLLLEFEKSHRPQPISDIETFLRELEVFLQEGILNLFLKEGSDILGEVKDTSLSKGKDVEQDVRELLMAGIRVYKFGYLKDRRDLVKKRKKLLYEFILGNIFLPEAGLGSTIRRDAARHLMITGVLASDDITIFQPGLELVIESLIEAELMHSAGFYEIFYGFLKDTERLPHFAEALVVVLRKAVRNEVRLLDIKSQELFLEETKRIIIKLAGEMPSLRREFIKALESGPEEDIQNPHNAGLKKELLKQEFPVEGAESEGTDDALRGGGIGKLVYISIEGIRSLRDGRVEVRAGVRKLGSKKKERVIIYGVRRGDEQPPALYVFAETGIPDIDDAIYRVIEENPEIDDIIIEDAKFEKWSLLTLADISGIGVGVKNTRTGKPFRALHNHLSDDQIARFHELAHMAHDQGFLKLDNLLSHIPEGRLKREYYTNPIGYIKMITGHEAPESVKLHYALIALQRQTNVFGNKDRELTESISFIGNLKPNPNVSSYLKKAEDAEKQANSYKKSAKHGEAAKNWTKAMRDYFKLNNFKKAVECKDNAAENWFIAGRNYYNEGKPKKALPCLEKAATLYKELDDGYWLAQCRSISGQCYFDLKKFNKALNYFMKSAKLYEKLGNKRNAAMNYARVALTCVILAESTPAHRKAERSRYYKKAGSYDKRSAELNVEIGEPWMAIEHYIYARENFKKGDMTNDAEKCMQKAGEINKDFFDRINIIKSILDNKELNHNAVDRLIRRPEILTLVGIKPATAQPAIGIDIGLIEDMRHILKRCFNNQIGLVRYKVPVGGGLPESETWYCIYDKAKIRMVVKDNATLFNKNETKNLKTDTALHKFMKKMMRKDGRCGVLFGYLRKDVYDFIKYHRLWKEADIPLTGGKMLDPNDPSYSWKLSQLKIKDLKFIKQFYQAYLAYKEKRSGLLSKIDFDWISIREHEKNLHVNRYLAVVDILKVLVKQRRPKEKPESLYRVVPDIDGLKDMDEGQRVLAAMAAQA